MGIEKLEAIVLRSFPLGDTSRVVHLLTAERGRVHVVAKGVRGPRSRFGAALEPFTRLAAVVYYRTERDLQLLSQAEIVTRRAVLGNSVVRFAYASAVIELVDQALAGEERTAGLFELVDATLAGLEQVAEAELRFAFMAFIVRLLAAAGYRPELGHCVVCGGGIGEGTAFLAERGGLGCRRCASADPGALPLATEARGALAELAAGAAPRVIGRAAGDEMARALDAFLRAHLPRYRGLRSLKVVREVSAGG
jgi:DNA repair protein RecO (recombination protein O)